MLGCSPSGAISSWDQSIDAQLLKEVEEGIVGRLVCNEPKPAALTHLWTPLAVQGLSDHVQIGLAAAIYPA